MSRRHVLCATASLLSAAVVLASASRAAITLTTLHGPDGDFDHTVFDSLLSDTDVIAGMIATERPGDNGWHPANTNPADRLPAFTDGQGGVRTLTGLLNDFPGEGSPTKLLQYDLPAPTNIGGINILAGNSNDFDGRVFVNVRILTSTDNGANFTPLGGFVPGVGANSEGYYESDEPLAINRELGAGDGFLETLSTFMQIADDASSPIALGVTNIQFDFYSTNNTAGWHWDAFDGVNPFSGFDDGMAEAVSSPLIWEIDVLEAEAAVENADFDGNLTVNGRDGLFWQRGFGIDDGTAQLGDGDANGDGNVNGADRQVWESQYGLGVSAASAVMPTPEPSTAVTLSVAMVSIVGWTRRRGVR